MEKLYSEENTVWTGKERLYRAS